jgi:phenylalanyl-tRNA synthetase alpha chain
MDIKAQIENYKKQLEEDLVANKDFDAIYLKYFGKQTGLITELVKQLPSLSSEEKTEVGPLLNVFKEESKVVIDEARLQGSEKRITDAGIDLTLPLKPKKSGYLHPTTQIIREMDEFFHYHGYSIAEAPEIETVDYNFRKLNLPDDHPATDLQDTLFIQTPEILMRTHTSSVEARVLTDSKPPIRAAGAGKVYRNETASKSNAAFFHQYQGFLVDEGITLEHLKGTLTQIHQFLFGEDVKLRFRYKYYPEVSPGMGVDMECQLCNGKGCETCKLRGWMETLGSGMIHYNTLKMCGIDPEIYTGFAFGMGLDRLVMQRFGISDIRKLYGGGVVYKD